MEKKNKIFLVGFMGCGKSTVGKLLSMKMGRPFFDIDHLIEHESGKKVSEIFHDQGEEHFRVLESEVVKRLCQGKKSVISGGGGCFCDRGNRAVIMKSCHTVFLSADIERLKSRIGKGDNRPKSHDPVELVRLYHARLQDYEQAEIRVEVEDKSPLQIVEEILEQLL
ncbi:MAG: shikimate kinase [Candidatus Wallbacteria bacterium]|nr:shikimate kinase [Candidatus Wallbacteria bacterium]